MLCHLFGLYFSVFMFFVLIVGGYIHGRHNLTYGVDLDHIRWLGVLQVTYILHFFFAFFTAISTFLLVIIFLIENSYWILSSSNS
jgi:hypothetical protein